MTVIEFKHGNKTIDYSFTIFSFHQDTFKRMFSIITSNNIYKHLLEGVAGVAWHFHRLLGQYINYYSRDILAERKICQ